MRRSTSRRCRRIWTRRSTFIPSATQRAIDPPLLSPSCQVRFGRLAHWSGPEFDLLLQRCPPHRRDIQTVDVRTLKRRTGKRDAWHLPPVQPADRARPRSRKGAPGLLALQPLSTRLAGCLVSTWPLWFVLDEPPTSTRSNTRPGGRTYPVARVWSAIAGHAPGRGLPIIDASASRDDLREIAEISRDLQVGPGNEAP